MELLTDNTTIINIL